MSTHGEDKRPLDVERFSADTAKKINGMATGALVVGLLGGAAGYFMDAKAFPSAYLTSFFWLLTIGLGGLWFVLIQHVVRAGWSVAPRRHAEWLTAILPAAAVLFLPLIAFAPTLWSHWMGEHAHHDPLIVAKHGYLNPTFFYIRAAIYFVIWIVVSIWFYNRSATLDTKRDDTVVEKMQAVAAPCLFLFGFSITFAGIDWLMSLDPHWYSTIFGVYLFAGAVTSALSVLCLINIRLQGAGLLSRVSNVEHNHDLGKLLFGFIVFFAYIGFSQYFLIWYANIPEETIFYKERWVPGWQTISLMILFGHFVVPFLVLLSRHPKRNPMILAIVAAWMIFMHWIDIYWLVKPNFDHHGAHFGIADIGALLLMAGVGAFVVARRATGSALFPLHDPRVPEAMRAENL
jgi:hypothetical protein